MLPAWGEGTFCQGLLLVNHTGEVTQRFALSSLTWTKSLDLQSVILLMFYVYHHQCGAKPQTSSTCLLGTWQSPSPGFSLGSSRWHQTGCVCLAIPRRWKSRLEAGKPSFICAYYPASWSILNLILWIWGRMRSCFLQIVKDLMEWKMKNLFCDLHYFFNLWTNEGVQWFWHWWFYNFKGVCQTRYKVLLF